MSVAPKYGVMVFFLQFRPESVFVLGSVIFEPRPKLLICILFQFLQIVGLCI